MFLADESAGFVLHLVHRALEATLHERGDAVGAAETGGEIVAFTEVFRFDVAEVVDQPPVRRVVCRRGVHAGAARQGQAGQRYDEGQNERFHGRMRMAVLLWRN